MVFEQMMIMLAAFDVPKNNKMTFFQIIPMQYSKDSFK